MLSIKSGIQSLHTLDGHTSNSPHHGLRLVSYFDNPGKSMNSKPVAITALISEGGPSIHFVLLRQVSCVIGLVFDIEWPYISEVSCSQQLRQAGFPMNPGFRHVARGPPLGPFPAMSIARLPEAVPANPLDFQILIASGTVLCT